MTDTARRVALVTDAAHYVGPELARLLAARGHDLVLGDPAPELVDELRAIGSKVVAVEGVLDLSDPGSSQRLVEAAMGEFGRLDAAAGGSGRVIVGRFLDSVAEDLDKVIQGCMVAPYHLLRAVVPAMVAQGHGQVLLITSASAVRPTPGAPLYSAARAGATMLAKNVALEVARTGVQVNAVGTNFMDFPEFLKANRVTDAESRSKVEQMVPMKRLGTMEEFAAFCMPFIDGTSGFTTGQFVAYAGMGLMAPDPVTTETVTVRDSLEPHFVFGEQEERAAAVLERYRGADGRQPNILVILFDDVGWGDFGCYGGGVAVGAPTPHIDKLARAGKLLTSCYSEPSCTPSRASLMTGRLPMRHGLLRPPMYGQPGGLDGEVTLASLLSDAGYVTQAVGKWHIGENVESQPQNVGFDDFYGFLSVSDMYTEWRDPNFFPEIVYSEARTEWVKNLPFNKCFVHATRGGETENVEEVTIPVLSLLDDKWTDYSLEFIRRMGEQGSAGRRPWFLYHCTRGAHFDNYPHERFLGASAAKHPYKDTIIELDDIVGRLVARLEATGQLEDTLVFVSSDNGPEMETWPDAAYSPFRSAKGSTWEGGQRVPGIVSWPGVIAADRATDGIFSLMDLFNTCLNLGGAGHSVPEDRFIDGVDQTSFLLDPDGASNRKYLYYWLTNVFSARRVGEWKFMVASTSDDDRDCLNLGGFTGVTQKYSHGRLYNLYLDPKESHSYMIRKLAYIDSFTGGIGRHFSTFGKYPPKHPIASMS